jgi:hypothetical protein
MKQRETQCLTVECASSVWAYEMFRFSSRLNWNSELNGDLRIKE